MMSVFTEDQIRRYSRHILLPQVGGRRQRKLLAGRALVVGLGGLGSPASYYLTAAGVGTIGLVDGDVVDLSNLQRQILYATDDIGKPKVERAAARLRALNPDLSFLARRERVTPENAAALVEGFDVAIDALDNFEGRYALNEACVKAGIPLCHAAIYRLDGQATTILPGKTPCYRCLYPEPPPAGLMPTCRDAGLLGVVPAVMALIQATEAIKLLAGFGNLLAGQVLSYNAMDMHFQKVAVRRDPNCPVCAD
jgi:adenylyltransferase/sulfurtransferase